MTFKQKKSLFIQALTIPIAAINIVKICNDAANKENIKVESMQVLFSETLKKIKKAKTEKHFDLIFKWFEIETLKINSMPPIPNFERGGIMLKENKNEKHKSKRTN